MLRPQEATAIVKAIEKVSEAEKLQISEKINAQKLNQNTSVSSLSKEIKEEVVESVHEKISLNTIDFTNKVLFSWAIKEGAEIFLRSVALFFFCYLMYTQVVFINELIMGIATQGWELNDFTLNLFVSVVFFEITALITVALKYLFKERTTNVLDIIKDVFNNASTNNNDFNKKK